MNNPPQFFGRRAGGGPCPPRDEIPLYHMPPHFVNWQSAQTFNLKDPEFCALLLLAI